MNRNKEKNKKQKGKNKDFDYEFANPLLPNEELEKNKRDSNQQSQS